MAWALVDRQLSQPAFSLKAYLLVVEMLLSAHADGRPMRHRAMSQNA